MAIIRKKKVVSDSNGDSETPIEDQSMLGFSEQENNGNAAPLTPETQSASGANGGGSAQQPERIPAQAPAQAPAQGQARREFSGNPGYPGYPGIPRKDASGEAPRNPRVANGQAGQPERRHPRADNTGAGADTAGNKQVKKVLSLPADQEPLYIIPVGYAD